MLQPIDALKGNLLLFSRNQIERWISEIQRALGPDNDVVRAVETLSLISICEHFVFPVRSHRDEGSQNARTIDQSMPAVEGIAVRVAQCDQFFFFAVWINAIILLIVSSLT